MALRSERSSGSAVRFPVITTLLMLVAATAPLPFGSLRSRCAGVLRFCASCASSLDRVAGATALVTSLIALAGRVSRAAPARSRGRAEDLVPVWRADPEAARVVLEVVAHVPFAQHPPEPSARAEMVQVVVHHVVDEVAEEEAGADPRRVALAEDHVEQAENRRR